MAEFTEVMKQKKRMCDTFASEGCNTCDGKFWKEEYKEPSEV